MAHLNPWWPSSFTYIRLTRPPWVKIFRVELAVQVHLGKSVHRLAGVYVCHLVESIPAEYIGIFANVYEYGNNNWGVLTQWGRVTNICAGNLTIIGSNNGLSPRGCLAIIWTNAGILLIGPLGTNFSKILIEIQIFSFKKIHLKMSSGKRGPFCFGLNVWKIYPWNTPAPNHHMCSLFS